MESLLSHNAKRKVKKRYLQKNKYFAMIPSLSDQSYIALSLTLSVLKRNIYDLVTYNKFPGETEKQLIDKGEKLLKGSLNIDDYIKEITKELEKELKTKIDINEFILNQIEMRLKPMIIQAQNKRDLEKETNKDIKKDSTLKESESNNITTIDPRFKGLSEKDKLFILRIMFMLGIGHSGIITKPILDKTIQSLKANYDLLEPSIQLNANRILSQIDPSDWKKFKSKNPMDYLLNKQNKEGELVLEQYGELKEDNSPTFSIQKYPIVYDKNTNIFTTKGSDLSWQFNTNTGARIILKSDNTGKRMTFYFEKPEYSNKDKDPNKWIYKEPNTEIELHVLNK